MHLQSMKVKASDHQRIANAIAELMRRVFYESTPEQRKYFARLSSTYALLFALRQEPRIAEYFQKMQADFTLLVGSDIIIRALSEHYLHKPDQMIANALTLIQAAGGKLVLTEPVFDEVWSHIRASDHEFQNRYRVAEPNIDTNLARQSDRILIRAYLYSKLATPSGIIPPKSWSNFVDQFCEYGDLHTKRGYEMLRRYIMTRFNMRFEDRQDLCPDCDPHEIEELAAKLFTEKKNEMLAQNDALMTFAVYARRRKHKERVVHSQFGLKTWWLTSERRVLWHTESLVRKQGTGYMMRPEFLLNFISLAPSAADIRKTYQEIFPSKLGIQLSRRVDAKALDKILRTANEAAGLDDARRASAIASYSDDIKSDFAKSYSGQLEVEDASRSHQAVQLRKPAAKQRRKSA